MTIDSTAGGVTVHLSATGEVQVQHPGATLAGHTARLVRPRQLTLRLLATVSPDLPARQPGRGLLATAGLEAVGQETRLTLTLAADTSFVVVRGPRGVTVFLGQDRAPASPIPAAPRTATSNAPSSAIPTSSAPQPPAAELPTPAPSRDRTLRVGSGPAVPARPGGSVAAIIRPLRPTDSSIVVTDLEAEALSSTLISVRRPVVTPGQGVSVRPAPASAHTDGEATREFTRLEVPEYGHPELAVATITLPPSHRPFAVLVRGHGDDCVRILPGAQYVAYTDVVGCSASERPRPLAGELVRTVLSGSDALRDTVTILVPNRIGTVRVVHEKRLVGALSTYWPLLGEEPATAWLTIPSSAGPGATP